MRARKYHPPHFTPHELQLYSLIAVPPAALAYILGRTFEWSRWIALSVAIVSVTVAITVQARARVRRLQRIGAELKSKAAERRAAKAHA